LLALHQDWQSQIRQEAEQATAIESGEAKLAALPLTLQVVKEAMRLYPPAPILVRTAQRQTAILGHKVKKGQVVILNIHALHRHEKIWKDPGTFHPERFSETAPSRHRAAFIPFSAGPRMCLAMNFALAEMTILVSEMARTYQLAPVKPEPNVSLQITTHSTTGLNVTATKI
jgi:cytochrome P450